MQDLILLPPSFLFHPLFTLFFFPSLHPHVTALRFLLISDVLFVFLHFLPFISSLGLFFRPRYVYGSVWLFTGATQSLLGAPETSWVWGDAPKRNVFDLWPLLRAIFIGKVGLPCVSVGTETLSWESGWSGLHRTSFTSSLAHVVLFLRIRKVENQRRRSTRRIQNELKGAFNVQQSKDKQF